MVEVPPQLSAAGGTEKLAANPAKRTFPGGDDNTITEARRLVNAYLETYAPEA
ncbi:hypothetical protein Rhow_001332 [Rhodococcus wratislaviensis]|uniref:Uncharacterized protein n=1 Tax=Rhodococcus wratislaviensis TaxID=44752 RepID=A0A402C3T0_RHOWR|nr:hypothetical protein [Rhodococcus wratislaviensis]GCE38280.1 hypothetical protein Rhow_001332 [Rhodococcus wratislaviensis]